ncbi:MAG: phosphoribosyl-AMP cyclohydrolase, partial [Clostridia bacterium]|nr:phosphoribosyl-AMP cyclohydrolase [Clostridia bacterium]
SAAETAKKFYDAGARHLHVVDLDGAKAGKPKNLDVLSEIKATADLEIEFGGGVRDMATIEAVLSAGASHVILGSVALKNKPLVVEAVKAFGDKITVGIDAKDGYVSTEGWLTDSKVSYIELARAMEDIGVRTIVFTDIGRDGTLMRPNFSQLWALSDAVSCNIIASGGVRDIEDINTVAHMGLYGVIAGKSLYSGSLDLSDAISVKKNGAPPLPYDIERFFEKNDLIPAVVEDKITNKTLMLAYMNRESLKRTLLTGQTWFWSRSRGELWNKGATSGHIQNVSEISYDCDCDTLLISVEQIGAACHTGNRSCFYRTLKKF